ncbi:Lrp/AsnC family transcriptional regulator [Rhodococcus sp. OK302]|uniref:Lrp/AsnC family transcriptional regulator n=1 Tax=Rhodococcus sp. OK302 TaxID=1882769 RepID=UPI0034E8D934
MAAYLAEDGRRSSAEISELVDLSEATVRRRISRLQSSGQLTLRCDVARESSGYPIGVWYLCRIPSDKITAAGTALGKLAPVRMCTAVDGSANLIIQAWVQNLEQVSAFESKHSLTHCQACRSTDRRARPSNLKYPRVGQN